MIDRAPEIAAYLVERGDDGAGPNVLWNELRQRWPGVTPEEGTRGARIAEEFLAAALAEREAAHVVVVRALAEWRAASEAIAKYGDAEFQEIATGTGLPLDAVRDVMRALRGIDPLSPVEGQSGEDDHADRDR